MRLEQKCDGYRDKIGVVRGVLPNGWKIIISPDAPRWLRELFAVAFPHLRLCDK